MSLINFDPFGTGRDIDRAFDNWSRRMEQMFRGYEQPSGQVSKSGTQSGSLMLPAIDVIDGEKEIVVHTELPGLKKEDIKVEVVDNQLVISGESKSETKFEDHNYVRRERSFGQFKRSVGLPKNVDTHKINAKYENGLLEVTLPKVEASQQRKQISIN